MKVAGKTRFAILIAAIAALAVAPASAVAVTFNGPTNYPIAAGADPEDIAFGDFLNNDQLGYVATGAPIGDTAYAVTRQNNGDGTFGGQFGWSTGATDAYTISVATGDFNADGLDDFASGNFNAFSPSFNNMWIHLSDGDSTFTSFDVAVMGQSVSDLAVGTFNAGAALDIVAANGAADTVSVSLGAGNGSFPNGTQFSVGDNPTGVAVADFNADGNRDIVTANRNTDNVSVLLGNGSGGFGAATGYAAGDGAADVAVGLFNADPFLDLAVSNSIGDNVSILLGNGSGGFGAPTNFAAGDGAVSIATGEFGTDAAVDLAVANQSSNNVSILTGTGTGTFGTAQNFSVGSFPRSVVVGDLDDNGKDDFATANLNSDNVSVRLQEGTPKITTSATANAEIGGTITDSATLTLGSAPTGTITFRAYAPGDTTCTGSPVYTSAGVNVNGNGTYNNPTPYTPTALGTYRWIASYSGDSNNTPAAGACNDANENSVVGQATPSISTLATDEALVGDEITDTATISGGHNPTGTISFTAWGPGVPLCNSTAVYFETVPVNGNGSYESPPLDTTSIGPGTYRWVASYSGDTNNAPTSGACNDPGENTDVFQSTTLTTQATATAAIGGSISDTATLAGGTSPTGTITFRAYGPADPTCSGTPAFTDTETIAGNGPYTTNPAFTPTSAGTYRWIASYSGDATNAPSAGACNDANETSTIPKTSPTLSTAATATVTLGGNITDTATLAGGSDPGGTITFDAYGPDDADCSDPAVFTDAVVVDGNDDYSPDTPFTPTQAGTYRWIASYSGDINNDAVSGDCNDAGETSTVEKVDPTISTDATDEVEIGSSISDTATLASGTSPTGTITFRAYGPADATCSGTAAFTDTETVSGNGDYTTNPAFTPATAGTYRWIASYSGDANNEAVSGACNDTGETSTVTKDEPTLSTQATANGLAGGQFSDTATLAGGTSPTGTITFSVYGPADATCTGTAAFTDTETVSGNGDYTTNPAFTATVAGTYRWVASYSGDANNEAVSGACNDANETSTVAQAQPSLATQATASAALGSPISDTATLAAGAAPTGTITFEAYGPADADCSGTPAFTDTETVSGNGNYTTNPAFTPATAGTYRWIASYSGDANNEAIEGECNDPNETSTVSDNPPPPPPSNNFTIGGLKGRALTVTLSSAGTVRIAANKQLKPSSASGGPGAVKLKIVLKKKANKQFKKKGKLKLKPLLTFTPNGGTAASQSAKRVLKKKKKKK